MSARFPVSGVLVVDKPVGMSSNQCLQRAKRLLNADKAGHTGSLDPLACGVLPLCFGEATKVAQFLLDSDKAYRTIVQLGVKTTSGDRDGDIVSTRSVPDFSEQEIRVVLDTFLGTITQQPSIYSALKQNGVPLYKLARAGKEAEIVPKFREIQIHTIELLRWEKPEIELRVSCSKGSYIRTLAEDIGEALGTGAHLSYLRREQAGPFSLSHSITLEDLAAKMAANPAAANNLLLPVDMPLQHLPELKLNEGDTLGIRQGKTVPQEKAELAGAVRLYCGSEFIGIGEIDDAGVLKAKRLISY
ncbi:MAG: tRNA pseudouridine(55) synthase TruB [Pseudomonadota bacterium]